MKIVRFVASNDHFVALGKRELSFGQGHRFGVRASSLGHSIHWWYDSWPWMIWLLTLDDMTLDSGWLQTIYNLTRLSWIYGVALVDLVTSVFDRIVCLTLMMEPYGGTLMEPWDKRNPNRDFTKWPHRYKQRCLISKMPNNHQNPNQKHKLQWQSLHTYLFQAERLKF